MRVVCLSTRYHVAGATNVAVTLADAFAESGHTVESWFVYRAGEMPPRKVRQRILIEKAPKTQSNWWDLCQSYLTALKKFRPDVIIGFHPLANVLGAFAKLQTGCSFIASQHNPAKSQRFILQNLDRVTGGTSLYNHIVCVSEAVSRTFESYPKSYRDKIRTIHNGLPQLTTISNDQATARRRLNLPPKGVIVGSLGRLHPQKNIEFLIAVAATTKQLHFAIAGEGPNEQQLRAQVKELSLSDRVHFTGNLVGKNVSRFYRAIDIFAMPSRYEGFGLTLVEAMSMGVPVLCSNLESLREVGGPAARYLDLNIEDWKKALHEFANNPTKHTEMRQLGQKRATKFSQAQMVQKYLDLLEQ